MEESPGRVSKSAVLAVGRPGGVGICTTHRVDAKGQFDFTMSATEENNLYVYDGRGDPVTTLRRVNRGDINDHMKLLVPPGRMDTEMMVPEMP